MENTICYECGTYQQVPAHYIGQEIKCNQCGVTFTAVNAAKTKNPVRQQQKVNPVSASPTKQTETMDSSNLIKCPSCGKSISRQAASCPDCGHTFSRNNGGVNLSDPIHLIGVILAILAGIGVVIMVSGAFS